MSACNGGTKNPFLFPYRECIRSDFLNNGFQADICLFKVNNGNSRIMYEICSKVSNKSEQLQWCQWHGSGIFMLTLNRFDTLFWYFNCWRWIGNVGWVYLCYGLQYHFWNWKRRILLVESLLCCSILSELGWHSAILTFFNFEKV